jgi:hypothetical protein
MWWLACSLVMTGCMGGTGVIGDVIASEQPNQVDSNAHESVWRTAMGSAEGLMRQSAIELAEAMRLEAEADAADAAQNHQAASRARADAQKRYEEAARLEQQAQRELELVREQLGVMQSEIAALQSQLASIQQSSDPLSETLRQKIAQRQQLIDDIQRATARISTLQSELTDLRRQVALRRVSTRTRVVSKLFGNPNRADSSFGIPAPNTNILGFYTGDLGSVTKYKNKYWFAFGDSLLDDSKIEFAHTWPVMTQFVVFHASDLQFEDGIKLDGMVNYDGHQIRSESEVPRSVVSHYRPDRPITRPIPNSMFVLKDAQGNEHLFAQFLQGGSMAGNDHGSFWAGIVKYNDQRDIFEPYKPDVNFWPGTLRYGPNQYEYTPTRAFQQADFVVQDDYLYMLGSASGRYGGLHVARMRVQDFLSPTSTRAWEYLQKDDTWSAPTTDIETILASKWVITPKMNDVRLNPHAAGHGDYFFHLSRYTRVNGAPVFDFEEYFVAALNDRSLVFPLQTIGEFSVEYLPQTKSYILMTGRYGNVDEPSGQYVYTAPNPWGPWKEYGSLFPRMDRPSLGWHWQFYASYTTASWIDETTQDIYFLGSTWEPESIGHGGVYLVKSSLAHLVFDLTGSLP